MTANEYKILACFFPKLKPLIAKILEKQTKLTHEPVYRTLKKLVKEKILSVKKIGQTNIYEINKSNEFFYQIFIHYASEKRLAFKAKHDLLYKRIYEFLNEIQPQEFTILFGSYAKGKETPRSDIDLLVVATNRERIKTIAKTYKTKYNLVFSVIVITPNDFENIKKDNMVFWEDLVNYGIIFDGLDYFFRRVYR